MTFLLAWMKLSRLNSLPRSHVTIVDWLHQYFPFSNIISGEFIFDAYNSFAWTFHRVFCLALSLPSIYCPIPINTLYTRVISILSYTKKNMREKREGGRVLTKSGSTGRNSAVFVATLWRMNEKTLLKSVLILTKRQEILESQAGPRLHLLIAMKISQS